MKRQQIIIFGTGEIAEPADFYFTQDFECEVAGINVDGSFLKQAEFCGRPIVAFEEVTENSRQVDFDAWSPSVQRDAVCWHRFGCGQL